MSKKIVLASGNKGKIREIADMLKGYEVVGYKDLGFDFEIEENGKTFYENALIKAKTISDIIKLPVLADDSGLEVDALNGAPGIYSARYAGDGNDEHNNQKLLANLKGESNRKAKFVCCMVVYFPSGKILTSYGETDGLILDEPQGTEGFGYDPIFYSLDLKKSLGVASFDEKNTISHRYRALVKIKLLMDKEQI